MVPIAGLHHVTAITGQARENVRFYTQVLGMRLVKKTVNQDDVSAYHLFYADAEGSPGTDLTFFDWPGAPANRHGPPAIGPISMGVESRQAIEWWVDAFQRSQVRHSAPVEEEGSLRLPFTDPEGQRLELVDVGGGLGGRPWSQSPVPPQFQVRGLHRVGLLSVRPQVTAQVLALLGFRRVEGSPSADGSVAFEVGPGGPGTQVRLLQPEAAGWGAQGRGGVHHVAFRVPDDAAQEQWRSRLAEAGLAPTPVIDRFYFKSVYFREPGGNLFELATDGPGFTADEGLESLGAGLALPPFLEPRRSQIEAGLVPLEA